MKHIFVVNPAAGTRDHAEDIKAKLAEYAEKTEHYIYCTKCPLDATRFVREYCKEHPEPVRFYACGGDGTLNEVINGAVGFNNAEVACYPCGSGDDFVKYYGGKEKFLDLPSNIEGTAETIDLMKIGDRYSVNVTNFGFDSYVAETISKVKRKFLIGGNNSYTTGIIRALFRGLKNKYVVSVDGERLNDKVMLLCTVSNGCYVGGSFMCAPRSRNNDGLLEVCFVKPLSIFTFLKLMKFYKEGTHLDNPLFSKHLIYRRANSVTCDTEGRKCPLSIDGEMVDTKGFTIEIVPAALKFVVPKGAVPFYTLGKQTDS